MLVEEARPLFHGQQDGGEQGDQVVQEGVVKGGGLLRVGEGQSRLDVVGCPSTNASRAAHDVVEEEEVVVEGCLQVLVSNQHLMLDGSHLMMKTGHNSVTPAPQVLHHLVIVCFLPEELEQHADGEPELLLRRVDHRGWDGTMLPSYDHIQEVVDTNSKQKVLKLST